MLRKVEIDNFKGFESFELELGSRTLLIGPNNAGKSTLVSALRLIAHLARPGQLRRFEDTGSGMVGVRVDPDALGIPTANLSHNYANRPSIITAYFDNDLRLTIRLSDSEPSFGAWSFDGIEIVRPEMVRKALTTTIGAVPPVGPLEMEEAILSERHVKREVDGPLSPRHFRNQWHHRFALGLDFAAFTELIEATLPGLEIFPSQIQMLPEKTILAMNFREGSFVGEIAWAGHGIQVWLQILTHLVRLQDRTCVILDEPDVYLHPDLQRRVVALGTSLGLEQFIVASHSVDILNEFAPEDVVIVDKAWTAGQPLADMEAVQRLMSDLGSTANTNVARLVRSKVCLFVEGDDFETLKRIGQIAGLPEFGEARDFAVVPIEGFSNWERLLHVEWVMKNLTGENIRFHVVLDRDYRCDDEVAEVTESLERMGVSCHVWERKELENYLLVPDAITSAVNKSAGKQVVSAERVAEMLHECADTQRTHVEAQRQASEVGYRIRSKSRLAPATINERVLEEIESSWEPGWYTMISGKDALAHLRSCLQNEGLPTPSNTAIAASMSREQVDPEIIEVLSRVARPRSARRLQRRS